MEENTLELGSGKDNKRLDLMAVGKMERLEIARAQLICGHFEVSTPTEAIPAESRYQVVGRDPSVTTVAVWEWMDRDEAMMKPHTELVRVVRLVLDPAPCIVG